MTAGSSVNRMNLITVRPEIPGDIEASNIPISRMINEYESISANNYL